MNLDLSGLDLDTLKAMYEKEEMNLKTKLLNGALWEEVKEQRKTVTELSIALHRKKFQSIQALNPAEHSSDDIEGR
jgi:hypothetical protein